ncbi:MAG: hypothetical protein HP490_13760 [Nitrospira sp.]|nr:hypothetical protein [Nitrospira sp.]
MKTTARVEAPFASEPIARVLPVADAAGPNQLKAALVPLPTLDGRGKSSIWWWVPLVTPDAIAAEPATNKSVESVLDEVSAMSPVHAAAIDEFYMLMAGAMTYLTAGVSEQYAQIENTSTASVPVSGQQGTATSSIGLHKRNGSTTIEIASEANVLLLGLKANSKVSLTTPFCPDANGQLSFTIKYSGNGSAGKEGAVSYDHNVEAKIIATVDDNANLANADIQLTQATRSTDGGKAIYVETSAKARAIDANYARWQYDDTQLVRESSQVSAADRDRLATKGLVQAAQLATGALAGAEMQWQSGLCIKINATSPGTVKLKATSKIPVSVIHRREGSAVPAKVTVELTGGQSVSPSVIPKAPGDVTHMAVEEPSKTMTIKLTAVSKRGKAKEELKISTAGNVFKIEGGADEFHGTGIVCDFTKPFKISGSGVNVTFTPSSEKGGTYTYKGNMSGFPVSGEGTYTVAYDGDTPVHMTGRGPGSVQTPVGTTSGGGTEEYTVTPMSGACPYSNMTLD